MYEPQYRHFSGSLSNGGRIALGIMILAFGLFLISPVAEWLLGLVGWLAIIGGTVVFATGVWSALRSRG